MNSNYGKSGNFDFDLGIGSNRPRSLNEQKKPNSSYSYSASSSSSFASTQSKPASQPNKPSWTHQPAPSQTTQAGLSNAPTSMVGDISGKSWGSAQPSGSVSGIGIVDKNPNLFGDLLGSALGQGAKSSSNVPLKNAAPASKISGGTSDKNSFLMGNMADSLPKTSATAKTSGSWGSSGNFGGYSSGYNNNSVNTNRSPNLGGPSIRSMGNGGGARSGMSSNKDPFGSLVDFGSKQSNSLNSASKGVKNNNTGDDGFGDFQDASKPSTTAFSSSSSSANNSNFMGSNSFGTNMGDFGMPAEKSAKPNLNPAQTSGGDPLDMFFSPSPASDGVGAAASGGFGGQQSSEVDDWGLDSGFGDGGHDMGGTTTELEGLPPPPAGISSSTAKNKGMDNYKQGQFADAIKWLSWAVILLEKAGDDAGMAEVLSSRASCFKEVGEYKKAVADCTKVLEQDEANVSVLVQRALLYESMEKYKLGAEDLRTVLKIDPGNRIARSTVHRLIKLAD
ncbi:Sperm-associated antigen 1 [Quillaja saponaria]|uniref:Sperm-associated antigen 1 n=1 Tax=Quillaja saponaria TaxID=32244 RepID=A0AAD7LBT7_QUISA|nr:Sperm-associated antigen 1 [Quillaja saponaria]